MVKKKTNLKGLNEDINFTEDQERGLRPIVKSPDPSPFMYLTKVFCPRCKLLLLVYYDKDPLRLPMKEGDPLDTYNYCRNCGIKLDMSDFKIRYVACK